MFNVKKIISAINFEFVYNSKYNSFENELLTFIKVTPQKIFSDKFKGGWENCQTKGWCYIQYSK